MLSLTSLEHLAPIVDEFAELKDGFKKIFDSQDPHKYAFRIDRVQVSVMVSCREPLPGHWDTDLVSFQKLIVLKCIRADKVTNAMQVSTTHPL